MIIAGNALFTRLLPWCRLALSRTPLATTFCILPLRAVIRARPLPHRVPLLQQPASPAVLAAVLAAV
jgi:hypothetical protein